MAVETLTLDLGTDPTVDGEPPAPGGLGRGLGAILAATAVERPRRGGLASLIPDTAESIDAPATLSPPTLAHGGDTDTTDLGADLVRALLDGLGSSMPLDLCAYVHQGRTERAHLTLRSPAFSTLDPSDGLELCDLLARRLRKGQSGPFEAAGYTGTTVATSGWASSGLYAVGRRRGLLGHGSLFAGVARRAFRHGSFLKACAGGSARAARGERGASGSLQDRDGVNVNAPAERNVEPAQDGRGVC